MKKLLLLSLLTIISLTTKAQFYYNGNSSNRDTVIKINGETTRVDIVDDENTNEISMKARAIRDAHEFYKKDGAASFGTFITTTLGGILPGLIPAIACSSTMPSDDNLNYPNPKLMDNREYNRAYKKTAKSIKQRHVWANYAIGVICDVILVATLITLTE